MTMRDKKPVRQRLFIEGLIIVFIAISPIIFYSYKYAPSDTNSLDFFFFEINKNGWPDARTNYWFFVSKLIPLTLLLIWFTTSKQWWYHALLIPIAMYAFQLVEVVSNPEYFDDNSVFYILAVTMVITPIVYFIRIKLVDKYVHGIDLKAMDEELNLLKEKARLEEELEKLRKKKEALAKKM